MNARQINAYLKRHNSPLAGYGNAFIRAGRQNGVSPALLVAISGAESSFGHINSGTNNPFGWGPGIDFPNYNAAISTIAKGLRQNYLNQGLKSIPQIASKWAPAGAGNDPTNLNSHWVNNVKHFLSELGGASPMGPQGPVSAPNATAPTNTSSAPNLAQFALSQLPQIGKGYDPIKSLSDLTNMVAMGGGPQTLGTGNVTAPPTRVPGRARRGSLAELFYDPLGAVKNGQSIPAIGGHSDHVHISTTNAQAMLAAINQARKMGLNVGENPYVGVVHHVHVQDSYHYRNFSGKYNGRKLGEAADISGSAQQMAAFFRWANRYLR